MTILAVNECFGPTIQGEGRSQGMPCIFLRMAACNLHCIWCDTPYTWNWTKTPFKHPDKYDPKKEIHKVKADDLLDQLKIFGEKFNIKFLVVTGGEPLLQQARLVEVLSPLQKDGWWIEVETNGTILPSSSFAACVTQFNISPKLANAGDPENIRIIPKVLKELALGNKCFFKFVVKSYTDTEEIEALINRFKIPAERVWLMPEGRTREELAVTEPIAAYVAKNKGWCYTDRRHILLFGNRRGV